MHAQVTIDYICDSNEPASVVTIIELFNDAS